MMKTKFFTLKLKKDKDLMTHINFIIALLHQLLELHKPLHKDNIVMTLLSSLPNSYSSFIVALGSISKKDLTLDYAIVRLAHRETKRKKL